MNASINWVTSLAELTASGLILWSFQALVLIALVRLLLSVWQAKSPALRHHIWVLALLAIALLPLAPLFKPHCCLWGQAIQSQQRSTIHRRLPFRRPSRELCRTRDS